MQYHRGGDLTDEARLLGSGAYVFGVSEAGWELTPLSGDAIHACWRVSAGGIGPSG